MRRLDDGHVQRPPPFRVLAASDGNYLSPNAIPPPPPRAPEPYKIAPSTTSSSRAHRRSSFVIIADSRPVSPEARSPSPPLATGRVSPFRGRGFKGPPPRSKSRAQSPEFMNARRRGNNERRVSVSQQNSPRRSLIPQPTRQRSTSLSKSTERLTSPKLGRRVDSRTRFNTTDSRNRLNASGNSSSVANLATRRQASKTVSKLSPIQGTPTKPEKTPQFKKRDRSKESTRLSPAKQQKFAASPSRNAWNAKKQTNEKVSVPGKTQGKERVVSPSKIPLKTNRTNSNVLNPARFINIPNPANGKNKKATDKGSKEVRISNGQTNESTQGSKQSDPGSKGSQANEKNSSTEQLADLHLIDLLKQTSSATGTSSVVNTTATTAVQPLHIDANAVLMDKEISERKSQSEKTKSQSEKTKSQQDLSNSKSSNSSNDENIGKQVQNSQVASSEDNRQISKSNKSNGNHGRTKGGTESRNDSPVPTENVSGHSKSNSTSHSVKSINRVISATNNTGSATQRSNKIQNAVNDQNTKNFRPNDQKIDESVSFQPVSTNVQSNSTKANEIESVNSSIRNSSGAETQRTAVSVASASVRQEDARTISRSTNNSGTKIVTNATTVTVKSTCVSVKGTSDQSTIASRANNVSNVVGAVSNDARNVNSAGMKARTDNHGSGTSVKSSARVSIDSIETVRSTDTGVSVDTVRGVSSPREKTGMHVVKRPQEIETLSGNVVYLEQNGEPAVLAAANGVGERAPDRLLTRWKRSLSRCCECCPRMRCLACRTDPKGLTWPGNHARSTTLVNRNEQPLARDNVPAGCWPKFKNRCRCKRLKEMKCCSKRSRVAPAEATVCCPPERRFGAICRRLFGNCKCKRNADAEHARNIRAKHSLTSVAPPPLSEEPKAKIPDVLVEHNSLMRGAIPCLPVPLAWFCLVWNVLLPGSGTVWSGIFNLCAGQPRFSAVAGVKSRLGAFVVNLMVGVGQLFTVLFCLVGWGWSIWWGVTLVRLARKYKRFKASEAANNDPEARGGEPAALPPGVPSHVLRGMERAR
ncbi:mechanosensory transduction mediator stumble [Bombus vancouverensis nearcticus]|nr:protein stum isoform X1 [Bombus vancouverensis nearcticus]